MDRFEEFTNTYQLLEKLGEGMGLIIRCQRSEIFEKMHRL